jgi:hypothetical protein
MNLINLTTSDYPASLWQVRQANPNVSFPADPTDEDLEPFGYANVQPTEQPSYNQRTKRLEEATPEAGDDGVYRQQWKVRAATKKEIAEYDLAFRPDPDWSSFKTTALGSTALNAILSEALQVVPVAASSLSPALLRVESYGPQDFAAAWATICASVPVSAEIIAEFQQVAEACNLPSEFVLSLQP